jgi:hypothetical protein
MTPTDLTPDDRAFIDRWGGQAHADAERLVAAAIARDREGLVEACICEHTLVHHDPSGRCHGTYGITQMYCSCQAFRTPEQARRLLALDAPEAQCRCGHAQRVHVTDVDWDEHSGCTSTGCDCRLFAIPEAQDAPEAQAGKEGSGG